jgi:excinuclease UvrABC ATPase subunit
MQFLSDLYVTCPECEGRRYKPHALKILLHGKSIHEVLGLTAEESVAWFSSPLFETSRKPRRSCFSSKCSTRPASAT